jgi:prepilin-type N-terminal cleavage/methylation domain-containing protein
VVGIKNKQAGFTILELIIATAVFSMILLLATNAIVQIGRLYYKGLTTTRTQEASRLVNDDVSRALQLSRKGDIKETGDKTNLDSVRTICIGDNRYTFVFDKRVGSDTVHGLWQDQTPGSGECLPVDLSSSSLTDGRELVGENMRLLEFNLVKTGATGTYTVKTTVAYGDNDLLTHYDENGQIRQVNDEAGLANALCRSAVSGSSFCAVSGLDTVVKKRIN